jgi:hypothetical protein
MTNRYIRYTLIVLAAALGVLIVFLVANYLSLRREQLINTRHIAFSELLEHHGPLPVSDAGIIRSWMTFDYVNKLFALPPSYLQTQLQITNTHYPKLTISSYEKSANLDAATFLMEVEGAVRSYSGPINATSTVPGTATSESI